MNRIAAIDIGSNTVQLLIAESANSRFRPLLFQLRTTRLGASKAANTLAKASIDATLAALAEYRGMIETSGVSRVRVIATSAVRDAQNREELLLAAKEQTGWSIEVLCGEEEARLSFLGATAFLAGTDAASRDMLLIDIGGSSSELARWRGGRLTAVSANVGAVRANSQGWDDLAKIQSRLAPVIGVRDGDKESLAIGAGGTITTAAGLLLGCKDYDRATIEGFALTAAGVEQLLAALQPLSIEQRRAFSPLLARRGEIIVEGLLITRAFFNLLPLTHLTVSGGGVLDGVLREL